MMDRVVLQVFGEIGWRPCRVIGSDEFFFDLSALGVLSQVHVMANTKAERLKVDWNLQGVVDVTHPMRCAIALVRLNRDVSVGRFRLRAPDHGLVLTTCIGTPAPGQEPQALRRLILDALEAIDLHWPSLQAIILH